MSFEGKEQKQRLKKKCKCKKQERLTQQDLEELMGIHRDTYKKVKGAWRRK
jgi:hypothetical protein